MSILIKTVRIYGFRGLENIEVSLEQTTVLTGMNNTGKTSFLKALQLALGNGKFMTKDDFFIKGNETNQEIKIDLLIISIDNKGNQINDFTEDWEILLTTDRIKTEEKSFIPLRTTITFDATKNTHKTQHYILQTWDSTINTEWFNSDNGQKTNFYFDELPFLYMDAQRDILDDIKLRSSYLGRMLSKIEYSDEDTQDIERQIEQLNEKAVNNSPILDNIKETLKELDTALSGQNDGIEITPFTKKIRDLNKGLTIYYNDSHESLPMEYHGMGTRSWSSLLTLKSFINFLDKNATKKQQVFFQY